MAMSADHDFMLHMRATSSTGKASAAGRRQMLTRNRALKLGRNDLLGTVGANLNDAFIIVFAESRNSQDVLTWCDRREDDSP